MEDLAENAKDLDDLSQAPLNDKVYKKSWIAYIRPIVIFLVLSIVIVSSLIIMSSGDIRHRSMNLLLITVGLNTIYLIYRIMYLKSYKLYMDDKGIWVSEGILPWQKGINGVKWRDLDRASFLTSMLSYIFKTYTVLLQHRYTKSHEIAISNIHKGNEAIIEINKHQH